MQSLSSKRNAINNPILSGLRAAFIHSTALSQAKWKDKWGSDAHSTSNPSKDADSRSDPSKQYGKYAKRVKRAEARRILRGIHSMNMSAKVLFQEGVSSCDAWRKKNGKTLFNESTPKNHNNQAHPNRRIRKKASINRSSHTTERVKDSRRRIRKSKGPHFHWDSDDREERIFESIFQGRSFYWMSGDLHDVKWRTSWGFNRRGWNKYSETYASDNEAPSIGAVSDRIALGLAPSGPLTLEDVKQAFRMSALKWHPDRNEGPSKVLAEEKFKRCGAAYKSLCDAFSDK